MTDPETVGEVDCLIQQRDSLLDHLMTRYCKLEGGDYVKAIWLEIRKLNDKIEHVVAYTPMTRAERELKEHGRSRFNETYLKYFKIQPPPFYFKGKDYSHRQRNNLH